MNHNDIFGVTMAGLEAGFKVLHITTLEISTCAPSSRLNDVLNEASQKDFDYIPVKSSNGRIVGVVERESGIAEGSVQDNMRLLDDSILVSADEPLTKFLPTLNRSPYRLVVRGTEIHGIVTFSDVAKLPVRLMAFTLVIHLEAVLGDVIRRECTQDEDWLSLLHPAQRKVVDDLLKARKKENIHLLSPIEVSGLGHKITAVSKLRRLAKLQNDRELIVTFRNSLAHDGDFVRECNGVKSLLERLRLVEDWIDKLKYDGSGQDKTDT